ncbi:MAG: hypothetical protein ACK45I_11665 [Bacteroidota bacterium]
MKKTSTTLLNLWLVCNILFAGQALAQNEAILTPTLLYKHSQQYGLHLNSSGLGGLNFRYGWHKTGDAKHILDVDFSRVRDPKEFQIYGTSDNPQQYSYGRLNMAFFLRTGYHQTVKITDRPYKNSIGLNITYGGGLSSALLKPIYLDIYNLFPDRSGGFIRPERYNPDIHTNPQYIFGNSNFFEGIENTAYRAGGYGRLALSAEWGAYPDDFHNLEAGFTVDFFPQGLPLMAKQDTRQFFFLLYIAYTYGLNN